MVSVEIDALTGTSSSIPGNFFPLESLRSMLYKIAAVFLDVLHCLVGWVWIVTFERKSRVNNKGSYVVRTELSEKPGPSI